MKRQLTYILLIFLSVTALADGRLRLYSHCISVKEGLLSNTVYELAQDQQGYIWMATSNGLYRVDTRLTDFTEKDFKGYYADGNLPFSEINAIHTAEDGTLWVAAVGAGLLKCRFDSDGNLSYTKITRREGLASNTVYSMMSDTDGYQIASRLKSDPRTASLPIIMLTALDDEEHQIRAYRAGADDYMVKPCNFRLLIARAIQLIKWRQSAPVNDAEPASGGESNTAIITSQADKVFLKKLEILTAQHLTDSNLSIDTLAEMMNMGRTKFFGRVKEMTGLSPNKYLLKIRMEKAADLLADGEMNVSEVSYKVGIQDPSYFNKVFKSYYGVAPSKYVREAQ